MSDIVLTTLNARYSHSALGLRYLAANMGDLSPRTRIVEFVIDQRPIDIVEQLLYHVPRIIGFGVYIWNVTATTEVVSILRRVAPQVIIIIGGPEVSFEWDTQPIVKLVDLLITGPADHAFANHCASILDGQAITTLVAHAETPDLASLRLPYTLYTDEDIAHRVLYIEASRGCPFKCEFCLSALDKTAWPFPLDFLLVELDTLHQRGARQFKFVDRTFNLKIETSARILQFFLDRLDNRLHLHFEVIPDHLPPALKTLICQFPPGQLQFEVGIQTYDPVVQARISRRQNNTRADENLHWLRHHTGVHLHTDLIVGLPGESLASIESGFNRLVALKPHEIQVGLLKRLRGAPIARHESTHRLVFSPVPPYTLLASDELDFPTMQRMTRFSRYWDMIANSGRFAITLPLILETCPFARFLKLSDTLYDHTHQTHGIALPRLFNQIFRILTESLGVSIDVATVALQADFASSGLKGRPVFSPRVLDSPNLRRAALSHLRQQRHAAAGDQTIG